MPRPLLFVSLILSVGLTETAVRAQPEPVGPTSSATEATVVAPCATQGNWLDLGTGATLPHADVIQSSARRRIVLLGENHADADHHRWQLHTIAAIHAVRPNIVIGLEMLPRRLQPALDRWVAGELNEQAFLAEAEWDSVWGYDPALYMPIFHFARHHRIPMVALNVDRDVVARVGRQGFAALTPAEREGVSPPAAASADYTAALADIFGEKARMARTTETPVGSAAAAAADGNNPQDDPAFIRFVEAQQTWDRAMAEALYAASERHEGGPVVAILGRGHVENGWGVARQLEDLGTDDVRLLLPISPAEACEPSDRTLADAVFILEERVGTSPPRPRLGIAFDEAADGVRVRSVAPGSVADEAGLRPDDVLLKAAGTPIGDGSELVAIVRRQPPGTWLPLVVARGGDTLDVIARFPPTSPAARP